jgi:hypothetical protein
MEIRLSNFTSSRSKLPELQGTRACVLQYRRLQLIERMTNHCFSRIALPYQAFNLIGFSLLGNYSSIKYFHLRNTLHLSLYSIFPLISIACIFYQTVLYSWTGSINSLSVGCEIAAKRVTIRHKNGFSRELCSAYARSFAPLKVKLGQFRFISKFTVLNTIHFIILSTTRLCILLPFD